MSEPGRKTLKRLVQNSRKRHGTRTDFKTSNEHFPGERQNNFSLGETPFHPRVKKHLEMLSEAGSVEERTNVISYLQQSYGNRYVQSLVASIKAQTTTRMIETEIQRQPEEEEEILQVTKPLQRQIEAEKISSPPEEELQTSPVVSIATQAPIRSLTNNIEQVKHAYPQNRDPNHKPPPVMVPVPSGGACVIVRGGAFDMWIGPNEPACVLGGMRLHESKHITDFQADPYYSTIPSSGTIPDGETFYYRNMDDARRFEHAACDVEMEWIRGQLAGNPAAADRTILESRLNVTLPAYRASFG